MDYITLINIICRAVNCEIDIVLKDLLKTGHGGEVFEVIEGLKLDNIIIDTDGVNVIFKNADVSTNLHTSGAMILHKCKMCGMVFASADRFKIKCPKCNAEFYVDTKEV